MTPTGQKEVTRNAADEPSGIACRIDFSLQHKRPCLTEGGRLSIRLKLPTSDMQHNECRHNRSIQQLSSPVWKLGSERKHMRHTIAPTWSEHAQNVTDDPDMTHLTVLTKSEIKEHLKFQCGFYPAARVAGSNCSRRYMSDNTGIKAST